MQTISNEFKGVVIGLMTTPKAYKKRKRENWEKKHNPYKYQYIYFRLLQNFWFMTETKSKLHSTIFVFKNFNVFFVYEIYYTLISLIFILLIYLFMTIYYFTVALKSMLSITFF